MPYQLPQVNVRVFTGDDVIGSSNTTVNAESKHNSTDSVDQAIDVAFVNKVKKLVSGSEAELESMKTNVSPVLRWVALMHDKQKAKNVTEKNKSKLQINELTTASAIQDLQKSTQATQSTDDKIQETSQSIDGDTDQKQPLLESQTSITANNTVASETTNANSVLSALSRRGVGFKDPLLERLKKRMLKEQRMQENAIAANNNSSKSTNDDNNNDNYSHVKSVQTSSPYPIEVVMPSITPTHWTERRLSEMQNSSWSIFREQVGILIEVYNRRHELHESNLVTSSRSILSHPHSSHAQKQQQEQVEQVQEERSNVITSSVAKAVSFALPRFTIDTIHPIRCWEEARLPYALGKCVSANYGFPTSVQCMCVPLANAVFIQPETTLIRTTTSKQENTFMHNDKMNTGSPNYIHKIDILAVAETGSGKTAAYMIPILTDILLHRPKLLNDPERISLGPFSLVLVPTRELADQVTREFNKLLLLLHVSSNAHTIPHKRSRHYDHEDEKNENVLEKWEKEEMALLASEEERESYAASHNLLSEIRVVKVTGGESTEVQFAQLSHGAHVVIGTVGQLSALLQERLLSLGNTQMVVIDEADRMIDDDYTNSLRNNLIEVLDRCPVERQTLLFTATLSAECTGIAKKYLSQCGYYIIRTPQRCASINQNFEVVPCTPLEWVATEKQTNNNNNINNDENNMQIEDRKRALHRLIHPTKFNRLVSWLAYCPLTPIVIFANEKKICDALQEELRNERTHLHELEQEFDLHTLLGPSPWHAIITSKKHMTNNASNKKTYKDTENESDVEIRREAIMLDNLSSVAVIHSELSQNERQRLVQLLHRGERKVLITTDLLARGLDLPHVGLVINYDLPEGNRTMHKRKNNNNNNNGEMALTQYIHRVGRTGRAGEQGTTVSFLSLPNDLVQRAMRVLNKITQNSNINSSTKSESIGGEAQWRNKNDALRRGIVAPGSSNETQLDLLEKMELTQPKHRIYGSTSLEDWTQDDDDDDVKNTISDSDDEEDNEEEEVEEDEGNAESMRNGQTDANSHNKNNGKSAEHTRNGRAHHESNSNKVETITFASDEAILTPLWNFLCECASSNGCSNAEDALRINGYPLIHLPPALSLLMIKLANSTSPYGTITK